MHEGQTGRSVVQITNRGRCSVVWIHRKQLVLVAQQNPPTAIIKGIIIGQRHHALVRVPGRKQAAMGGRKRSRVQTVNHPYIIPGNVSQQAAHRIEGECLTIRITVAARLKCLHKTRHPGRFVNHVERLPRVVTGYSVQHAGLIKRQGGKVVLRVRDRNRHTSIR